MSKYSTDTEIVTVAMNKALVVAIKTAAERDFSNASAVIRNAVVRDLREKGVLDGGR